MPNKITVKELKELLQKYNDEDVVEIDGGNFFYGSSMCDWAELSIDGEIIIEME